MYGPTVGAISLKDEARGTQRVHILGRLIVVNPLFLNLFTTLIRSFKHLVYQCWNALKEVIEIEVLS